MTWDDGTKVALLRAVADQRVMRRSIFRNSGSGVTRWFVGTGAASGYEASVLVDLYRAGLLADDHNGRIVLSARGLAKLTLHDS